MIKESTRWVNAYALSQRCNKQGEDYARVMVMRLFFSQLGLQESFGGSCVPDIYIAFSFLAGSFNLY